VQKAEQEAEQVDAQRRPLLPQNWRPGVSGNRLGRSNAARAARLAAKVAELSVEVGGVERLGAIDRVLIEQAASLLLRRPKSYDDQVRVTNSVQRILRGIAKRHGLDRRRPRTAINWLEVGR
jgi:hypothetical protein